MTLLFLTRFLNANRFPLRLKTLWRKLPLPVADAAAGPAWPGLDARIHRLGIERIAMAMGEPHARGAMPLHACDMDCPVRLRRPDGANGDLFRFDLEIVARPGGLAAAIAFGLDGHGSKFRGRPE